MKKIKLKKNLFQFNILEEQPYKTIKESNTGARVYIKTTLDHGVDTTRVIIFICHLFLFGSL